MKTITCAAALAVCVSPVWADIIVRFDESAPKDRFTITNDGACPVGSATVRLDMGASAAGLIFDVTGQGAGVSVFQPLELVAGQEYLASIPDVKDGDNLLDLSVQGLAAGASIAFTIDMDDTAGTTATMISGAEIQGAKVSVDSAGSRSAAVFGEDAVARVPFASCNA